jgi:hypothetical protein
MVRSDRDEIATPFYLAFAQENEDRKLGSVVARRIAEGVP